MKLIRELALMLREEPEGHGVMFYCRMPDDTPRDRPTVQAAYLIPYGIMQNLEGPFSTDVEDELGIMFCDIHEVIARKLFTAQEGTLPVDPGHTRVFGQCYHVMKFTMRCTPNKVHVLATVGRDSTVILDSTGKEVFQDISAAISDCDALVNMFMEIRREW